MPWLSEGRGRRLYLVGGSWRTLARYNMSLVDYPLHIVHNYGVRPIDLLTLIGSVVGQSKATLEKLSPILRRRSDTLSDSALVLERVIRLLEPSSVVFSSFGLREGLLFDLLSPEQQRIDPLLDYCSELAGRMSRFGSGQSLASWTDGLFAGEDAVIARLRHAACLLSDLGWIDHPDYRAEHALWRILRMPFPGVDHAERGFLAVASLTRYGGRSEEIPHAVRALLKTSLSMKTMVLGLALRLAHTLCGGATPILKRMPLRMIDERLVLCLPHDLSALAGDVVQRRLENLAKSVNRKGEIRTRSA
ncbi:hypothetical protein CCP2SC5_2050002 [Azospirillaceae bacterium]